MKKTLSFLLFALGALPLIAQDTDALIRFRIEQLGNTRKDETVIYFASGSSNAGVDASFDAYKVQFNPSGYPTIYTQSEAADKLSINAIGVLSDYTTIPLYLWLEATGNQQFKITEAKNFDTQAAAYLEDRWTGQMVPMSLNATYDFTASSTGFQTDRFFVHFYYFTKEWTAGDWSPAGAPSSSDNVRISDDYSTAANGNLSVKNLQINAGSTLSVGAGGTLNVAGHWLNSGSASFAAGSTVNLDGSAVQRGIEGDFSNLTLNNSAGAVLSNANSSVAQALTLTAGTLTTQGKLTLRSTASSTAYINAGGGGISGDVAIERYLIDNSVATASYRYFGVPFTDATVADFSATSYSANLSRAAEFNANPMGISATNFPNLFVYDEPRVVAFGSPNFVYGWYVPTATSHALPNGEGFIANIAHSQTAKMSGTVQLADVTVNDLGRNTNDSNGGWNLLGNPFATPIDLAQFLADNATEIDGSAYIRRATSQYGGGWQSITASGVSSPLGWNGTVGIMQGFFVHAKYDLADATFSLSNIAIPTTNTSFFRKQAQRFDGLLRLAIRSGSHSDEAVVYFDKSATRAFDSHFDAYKVQYNSKGTPTLFTYQDNNMLSINALPIEFLKTAEAIPLQLWLEQDGQHTFEALSIDDFPAGTAIYLEDRKTGAVANLANNRNYTFTANKGMQDGRFFLHFQQPETFAEELSVYAVGKNISIAFASEAQAHQAAVSIFSLQGQLIAQYSNDSNRGQMRIATQLPAGIYVVQVQHSAGTEGRKVFVE